MTDWTAKEIATLQSRLDKQLGPEYISTRPGAGGGKVHYLAAEKVINLANEVFGFNGWSSAIQNVQIDFVDENTTNGKITLGLSTIVRVTLRDGTYHEDIGYGHIENCKGKAAAFEKAKKEAATDALKRALRNFGNVLGNCLYDKDYLQRVTKIKVSNSKWDADNLHRHPDFAPVKREPAASTGGAEAQNGSNGSSNGHSNGNSHGNEAKRMSSLQSAHSYGSAEFEDDFGANVFDDTDFGHPDEVRLDDSRTMESPAQKQMNGQRNGVHRMHSMPQLRPDNAQQAQPPQKMQAPNQNPGVQRPPNNAGATQPSRMLPPQTPGTQQRNAAPPNGPPISNNVDGAGTRSHSSSAEDAQNQAGKAGGPSGNAAGNPAGYQPPVPQEPPPGVPEGFVTGRSAPLEDGKPPMPPVAFNPHAESPSIRRTQGINPGKSVPIMRQSLQTGQPNANGQPVQAPSAPPQPVNGAPTPIRSNFVNPSADPNRRIGMPGGGGGGGMQNRGAYKPPTSLKRPALTDVSNLPQVDGGTDQKKQRVQSPAPGAQAGHDGGTTS